MRYLVPFVAILGLAACGMEAARDERGVGFTDYDAYIAEKKAREAALANSAVPTGAVSDETADNATPATVSPAADTDETPTAASTVAANDTDPDTDTGGATETPGTVTGASGISQENDFEAVDAERSIESDAELIAKNRAQYQVVEATSVPTRTGSSGPSVVEYALATSNPPGKQVYRRAGIGQQARHTRNCARYASADLAQQDFLAKGGPDRDRMALDPDGDGFACTWDPRPYRKARGG